MIIAADVYKIVKRKKRVEKGKIKFQGKESKFNFNPE